MAATETGNVNELLRIRRDKLAELQNAGKNPFVITKYDGLDPELTHGTGVDRSIYPRPRTYMLGLSLNF